MENIFALILIGLIVSMPVRAAEQAMQSHKGSSEKQHLMGQMSARCFKSAGTVRKIDQSNNIVTIFHDAIPELGWPSMTMPFGVRKKELLGQFRVGEKVAFEFVIEEKNSVIVSVN